MDNSTDPDQTPRSVASDLGLYCLLRFLLAMGAEIIWLTVFTLSTGTPKLLTILVQQLVPDYC